MPEIKDVPEKMKVDSVICPWCKTYFATRPGTNCTNCGGQLPSPADSGERVHAPHPPRFFPDGFKRRMILRNNWRIYVGVAVILINFPTSLGSLPFSLLFVLGGGYVGWVGYDKARQKLNVLELGTATDGVVVEAGENSTVDMNGRHPYFIKYEYIVDGKKYNGSMNCWDESIVLYKAGDPVSVVYLHGIKDSSSLWPPIA
jgi:hypothetical protein